MQVVCPVLIELSSFYWSFTDVAVACSGFTQLKSKHCTNSRCASIWCNDSVQFVNWILRLAIHLANFVGTYASFQWNSLYSNFLSFSCPWDVRSVSRSPGSVAAWRCRRELPLWTILSCPTLCSCLRQSVVGRQNRKAKRFGMIAHSKLEKEMYGILECYQTFLFCFNLSA